MVGAPVGSAFVFPFLLKEIRTAALLYIHVGAFVVGATVTMLFGIETVGLNLGQVGGVNNEPKP